ncbi:MAG: hypothetical protein JO183_00630 [Ktedonobacteraceae bacterium]|nr:hypothetical protein [Ktedonobacteraceae bacterium]
MAKLKGSAQLENALDFSVAFSSDGQLATITFSNLLVSVSGKAPTVATQVASFTLPTIENTTDLHIQMTIRGFVETLPGTRAALVAHLGDTTAVASLPKSAPSGDNFQQDLEATLPAGVAVQTTVFLLVEGNSGKENPGALLTIDSLDFDISGRHAGKA